MSLSQQAYEQIRRKIISLEILPGAAINETSLIDELNVGRTPIREALLRLSLEQMVRIVPRRGMFVTDIAVKDLQRLFEVRIELEMLAARLAARRGTAVHWGRMQDLLERVADPQVREDNEALIAIDEACHRIIYEASDNPFLQNELSALYALSLRLWYYFLFQIGSMRPALDEHRLILQALQAGDESLSADLIKKHMLAFQKTIQARMMESPELAA